MARGKSTTFDDVEADDLLDELERLLPKIDNEVLMRAFKNVVREVRKFGREMRELSARVDRIEAEVGLLKRPTLTLVGGEGDA